MLGVIYVPVKNVFFVGMNGVGAEKIFNNQHHQLPKQNKLSNPPTVFAISRSHINQQTYNFIKKHRADTIAVGIKFKVMFIIMMIFRCLFIIND